MGDAVPQLVMLDTYAPGLYQEARKLDWRFYQPVLKPLKRFLTRWHLRRGRPVPLWLRSFYLIDIYDHAAMAYQPRPYDGRLTVFRAQEAWGPSDLGWQATCGRKVDVEVVPGDHYSMIQEPQVEQLSKKLDCALRAADNVQYFDGA